MTRLGLAGRCIQLLVVAGGAPVLAGVMRQVRARLEGRAGAGIGQPWRDLAKLLRKEPVTPDGDQRAVHALAPLSCSPPRRWQPRSPRS